MKAIILALALTALVIAQPPQFQTKYVSGTASYDKAITSSKGITYFSYSNTIMAIEMVDGQPKSTKFTIPGNQRLQFIDDSKNAAYVYDSSNKNLLRYALDSFTQDASYKLSLGKRMARFAIPEIDTLVVTESNTDYDYIFIQSLSNDKSEPFQIMRTQLGGIVYHPTSRRVFYQSNASDSKGVYELNFSSVSTGSFSPSKFQNMGYRQVPIEAINKYDSYNTVTKKYLITAKGTGPVVATFIDLTSSTFKSTDLTISNSDSSMQLVTMDYDLDVWGHKIGTNFQLRKDQEAIVTFNNYNNAVYNARDKWVAFSNAAVYYSFVNFCQDGKYFHQWTCVATCPYGYTGNFFKKECIKNGYVLQEQEQEGFLQKLLHNLGQQ